MNVCVCKHLFESHLHLLLDVPPVFEVKAIYTYFWMYLLF